MEDPIESTQDGDTCASNFAVGCFLYLLEKNLIDVRISLERILLAYKFLYTQQKIGFILKNLCFSQLIDDETNELECVLLVINKNMIVYFHDSQENLGGLYFKLIVKASATKNYLNSFGNFFDQAVSHAMGTWLDSLQAHLLQKLLLWQLTIDRN